VLYIKASEEEESPMADWSLFLNIR
jgi:hypothetical protein